MNFDLDNIKPPWVDKLDFYRLPFNFCDRWCEKCQFTSICRVFKDEQKRNRRFLRAGKDPRETKNVFDEIAVKLKKATRMIVKEAKKRGINLDDISADVKIIEVKPEDYPLVELTEKLCDKLDTFLENSLEILEDEPTAAIENQFEIVDYYHAFITGKVFRAVMSQIEEKKMREEPFDSKNSAFVAVNALVKISEALIILTKYAPLLPLHSTCITLAKASLDLARLLNSEFELEMI